MRNRQAVVLGIVAAVLTVAVAAQTDVTGEWAMMIDTEQGSQSTALDVGPGWRETDRVDGLPNGYPRV